MLYKRGKVYWYNFRWSMKQADGTVENFRIRQTAKTQNKNDAKNVEDEHRRALRLGEIHPNDPWPKAATSAPPVFRSFSKEFLKYAETNTKAGTHTFPAARHPLGHGANKPHRRRQGTRRHDF